MQVRGGTVTTYMTTYDIKQPPIALVYQRMSHQKMEWDGSTQMAAQMALHISAANEQWLVHPTAIHKTLQLQYCSTNITANTLATSVLD